MTKTTKLFLFLGLVGVAYIIFKSKKSAIETLNQWKENFDSKDLENMVNTYSPNAILVSTFGDILQGREAIKKYFAGLFKKDNLSVTYLDTPIETKIDGSIMFTGIYNFSYTENGKKVNAKARYSIITKDGQITKQHSSQVPN
jgi:uncharacterized protein (TIGR02246 family)